jgi:hypothetical protein
MYHPVTERLALAGAPAPDPTQEYTRATALEDKNAVMFVVWLVASNGAVSVKVFLEGSTDLCNWSPITDLTVSTVPSYTASATTGILPWAFVRLRYEVTSASSFSVFIRAGIETTTTT